MAEMTKSELFEILVSLKKANFAGGGRSPYKPLLVLWILGQLRATGKSEFLYSEIEAPVSALIDEFGPQSPNRFRAEMPFFHLENSIWEITGETELAPKRATLRKANAKGRIRPEVVELLHSEPSLIEEAARAIIDSDFTETYLRPIFSAVGLNEELTSSSGLIISIDQKKRDPKFRMTILKAWRMRCAMCGFDGQMGSTPVALEAAHVMWFSQGGPDVEENGLSLCELHHSLFDLGAMGISPQLKIIVSADFIGRSQIAETLVYELAGKDLFEPQPSVVGPSSNYVEWHLEQVFKSKAVA